MVVVPCPGWLAHGLARGLAGRARALVGMARACAGLLVSTRLAAALGKLLPSLVAVAGANAGLLRKGWAW